MVSDWVPSPGPSRPISPPQPPNTPICPELVRSSSGGPHLPIVVEECPEFEKLSPFFKLDAAVTEVYRLHGELNDARCRIAHDATVIRDLKDKVNELEELIQKQKVTISNQSKTISDRRHLRKNQSPMAMFPMTPHHQHPHNNLHLLHTYSQVHHNYQLPASAPGSYVASTSMMISPFPTPQSARYQQPVASIFDQPPPKFELPFVGPSHMTVAPTAHGQISVANSNHEGFWTMSSMTESGPGDIKSVIADFSSRFLELMRKTDLFGQIHGSLPNVYKDSHMDAKVKEYMMVISSRTNAYPLLGSPSTRCCLSAKAVNYYLIGEILTSTGVNGFDASVDHEILKIRKQIVSDTPASVRHLMMIAIATHMTTLTEKPGFHEFCHQRIQSHVEKLWNYVSPLTHDPLNQTGLAWAEIVNIVSEAHNLALDIHMSPLEFKFEFPELGEQFDPSTMINYDPYLQHDPQILKDNDARVRLSISPIVRIRDNSESPGDVNLMYLSNVLLKNPRKPVS